MAKQKYRFKERKFLNSDVERRAFIIATVPDSRELVSKMEKGTRAYSDVQLNIADCSRTIYLEFNLETPEDRRRALRKADILFDTIKGFRDALYEEAEFFGEVLDKRGLKK